jgi:hypothetical protein
MLAPPSRPSLENEVSAFYKSKHSGVHIYAEIQEAPRAVATLAIARAVLEKRKDIATN